MAKVDKDSYAKAKAEAKGMNYSVVKKTAKKKATKK